MSAAWYAKLATMNRATPRTGGTSAMKNVAPMHSAVKNSRNGIRRPPRSENAPRIGDTRALMPTLTTIASDRSDVAVALAELRGR